jgi:sugar phosphate isomerase/epimerase
MIPGFSAHGLGLIPPAADFGFPALAAAGFRCVDLRLRDLVESGIPASTVRTLLDDNGLIPGTCPFPLDWRGHAIAANAVTERLGPMLEYAGNLGIDRFYTRVSESLPEDSSPTEAIDDHRRKLVAIARRLADSGMCLAIETVGVESFRNGRPALMPTLKHVRTVLADCFAECPNLGLLVDAFHLHAADESVSDAVGPWIGRVFGVHLADLPRPLRSRSEILDHERALPGTTGQVPARSILEDLRRLGCPQRTPVIVETLKCPADLSDQPFDTIARAVFESMAGCLGQPA